MHLWSRKDLKKGWQISHVIRVWNELRTILNFKLISFATLPASPWTGWEQVHETQDNNNDRGWDGMRGKQAQEMSTMSLGLFFLFHSFYIFFLWLPTQITTTSWQHTTDGSMRVTGQQQQQWKCDGPRDVIDVSWVILVVCFFFVSFFLLILFFWLWTFY